MIKTTLRIENIAFVNRSHSYDKHQKASLTSDDMVVIKIRTDRNNNETKMAKVAQQKTNIDNMVWIN